jgi:uncharacterized membrane protein YhaH (DUF805 family)
MGTQKGFVAAFKDYWFRAGDFRGSSTRGQYWWIVLMNVIVALIFVAITWIVIFINLGFGVSNTISDNRMLWFLTSVGIVPLVYFTLFLYQGLPVLTLTIRRYRDAGVSPWALLVTVVAPALIPGMAGEQPVPLIIAAVLAVIGVVITVLPTRHPVPLWSMRPNEDSRPVGMGGAIVDFFRRGGIFSGRSSRSQYWWMILLYVLVSLASFIVFIPIVTFMAFQSIRQSNVSSFAPENLLSLWGFVIVITSFFTLPYLTLVVRRFRDGGFNPWWYLVIRLVTVGIGIYVVLNSIVVAAWIAYLVVAIVQIVILVWPTRTDLQNGHG